MFSRKYKLSSKHVKNDMGAYYVLDVAQVGATIEQDYKVAETWYMQFKEKAKDIRVHEEEAAAEKEQ